MQSVRKAAQVPLQSGMDQSHLAKTMTPIALLFFCGGCHSDLAAWKANARQEGLHRTLFLGAYGALTSEATRSYRRSNLDNHAEPPQPFHQETTERGRWEGSLFASRQRPIIDYLDPHSNRPKRSLFSWPSDPRRESKGFFLEFDPPLVEWPLWISSHDPAVFQSKLRAYAHDGRPMADGAAIRRVVFDGYESIVADGVSYPRCLRLRTDTDIRLSWWLAARVQEQVWLAEKVGIVRRMELISGSAMVFLPFRSSYQYELQRPAPAPTGPGRLEPKEFRWTHLAIHLDHVFPHPRVGGLIVD